MGIQFKKRSAFSLVVIIMLVSLLGCGKKINNSALNNFEFNREKSDVLAVIINNPSADSINKIAELKTFEYDKTSLESLILIPKYNNMNIEIKTIVFENDDFREDKTVYKEEKTKDGYGLLLKAIRPCGAPGLKICIEGNGMSGEYILSYNGKDGTPDIEYIVKKEE